MFLGMLQLTDSEDLKLMDWFLFKGPMVEGQLYIFFGQGTDVIQCEQITEFGYWIMG